MVSSWARVAPPVWAARPACTVVPPVGGLSTSSFLPVFQELHHKNRHWHEDCFRCAKCYKPLASEPFNARDDGKIMCGKCGSREDGNRCQGCYKVVLPGGGGGGRVFKSKVRLSLENLLTSWCFLAGLKWVGLN